MHTRACLPPLSRPALPLPQTLVANDVRVSVRAAVALAAASQPLPAGPAVQADVCAYVAGRLEQLLLSGEGAAGAEGVGGVGGRPPRPARRQQEGAGAGGVARARSTPVHQ